MKRRAGFSLIEVLAVVVLTGLVLGVAINFYLDLTHASEAALLRTRNARRAAMLLDRVSRDLESAVLVRKPDEVDPLAHPWLFLAEADDVDAGAQRLKFVSRAHRPQSPDLPESDLELVAWMLEPGQRNDFELHRWSAAHLPESLDRSFPRLEETQVVASGIAAFGVRLQADDGSWLSRWDSSLLGDTSELPLAAEISVSLFVDEESDLTDGPYIRRVLLPLRPLDLQAMLEAGDGESAQQDQDGDGIPDDQDEDDDGDGVADEEQEGKEEAGCTTVAACVALHPEQFGGLPPETQAVIQSVGTVCARDFAAQFPGIPADCMQ
jgi:prepilin-type N-terminal cleavage/methylation domain-containing protein